MEELKKHGEGETDSFGGYSSPGNESSGVPAISAVGFGGAFRFRHISLSLEDITMSFRSYTIFSFF